MVWKRVNAADVRGRRRPVGVRQCWLDGELVFLFVLIELERPAGRHVVQVFDRGRPAGFFECPGVVSATDPIMGELADHFVQRFENGPPFVPNV